MINNQERLDKIEKEITEFHELMKLHPSKGAFYQACQKLQKEKLDEFYVLAKRQYLDEQERILSRKGK